MGRFTCTREPPALAIAAKAPREPATAVTTPQPSPPSPGSSALLEPLQPRRRTALGCSRAHSGAHSSRPLEGATRGVVLLRAQALSHEREGGTIPGHRAKGSTRACDGDLDSSAISAPGLEGQALRPATPPSGRSPRGAARTKRPPVRDGHRRPRIPAPRSGHRKVLSSASHSAAGGPRRRSGPAPAGRGEGRSGLSQS